MQKFKIITPVPEVDVYRRGSGVHGHAQVNENRVGKSSIVDSLRQNRDDRLLMNENLVLGKQNGNKRGSDGLFRSFNLE